MNMTISLLPFLLGYLVGGLLCVYVIEFVRADIRARREERRQ